MSCIRLRGFLHLKQHSAGVDLLNMYVIDEGREDFSDF